MGSLIVLHAYSLWPQTWVATGMQENERKRTSIALFLSLCAQVAPNVCLHIAICLIRSSFTTLLTGETTCPTPTVPVQLSPSWRGAQTDAVALAGESVTWSAMGYLHRARAAGGSGNKEIVSHTHTHTQLASQRNAGTRVSTGKTRVGWQVNCRWVTASVRAPWRAGELQIRGSHPNKHFFCMGSKRQLEQLCNSHFHLTVDLWRPKSDCEIWSLLQCDLLRLDSLKIHAVDIGRPGE